MEENKRLELETYDENSEESLYEGLSEADLEKLKEARKIRYTENTRHINKNAKTIGKKMAIAIIVIIFIYYVAIFILNLGGIINGWVLIGLSLAGLAVLVVVYMLYKKKYGSDD